MRCNYVEVGNNVYTIEERLFCDLRPHAEGTSSSGWSPKTPLILPEISASNFEILCNAHTAEKLGTSSTFLYPDLLTVGLLAMRYRIKRLMKWFVMQFERLVCPSHAKMPDDAPEPSKEHPVEVFMLSTYLAASYGLQRALESLSRRWITRLHNRSLLAPPTIVFVYGRGANTPQLRHLLAHACYIYLADLSVEARNLGTKAAELLHSDFQGQRDDKRTFFPRRLYDQIRTGNCSLETTWEKMFRNPPQGQQGASCAMHARWTS
ncbi:hypothetical protein D9619_013130 [Psilocybe cf. subviscida]|uniref:Uncharacterized protein n=1 Tax=Psilocybe cf. subviscida TaxID=2480587 RepID=A0A8H5B679_9AGAR|nr:hypothetical protein D9619_013130 [Psilocybe cf. subviscida]